MRLSPLLLLLSSIGFSFSLMLKMSSIIVRKATEQDFSKMQIKQWATWGCEVSRFPWTYGDSETCYVIKGNVVVTPTSPAGEPVVIETGDIATFPAGLSCTWDVKETLSKHYMFN